MNCFKKLQKPIKDKKSNFNVISGCLYGLLTLCLYTIAPLPEYSSLVEGRADSPNR